jgi:hypothetical protein
MSKSSPALCLTAAAAALALCAHASGARAQSADAHESVRLRGGFSFNGGAGLGGADGPVASVGLRLGVQFNRWFSVYYQNSPLLFAVGTSNGLALGGMDLNSVLANFTLGDFFEIGVGPSVDYYSIAGCSTGDSSSVGASCAAASGAGFGAHGRAALNLGGRNAVTGRRSGFSIGLDAHPLFTGDRVVVLTTLGIGAEWF